MFACFLVLCLLNVGLTIGYSCLFDLVVVLWVVGFVIAVKLFDSVVIVSFGFLIVLNSRLVVCFGVFAFFCCLAALMLFVY